MAKFLSFILSFFAKILVRLQLLIRDRLGHKDIRITLNTYGHLYPNQQRKIANLLDNENGNAVTGLGEERDEC